MKQMLARVKKGWRFWLAPHNSDQETALWGYLTNIALLGFALAGLTMAILGTLLAWWGQPTGRVATISLALPLIAPLVLGLSHLGKVKLAAALLVATLIAMPFLAFRLSGQFTSGAVLWASAVALTVLLLNIRVAVLLAVLIAGGYLAATWSQAQSQPGAVTPWPLSLGLVELTVGLYTLVFLLWLAGRVLWETLQDTLVRTQDRVTELEEANRYHTELIARLQETTTAQARAVTEMEAVNTHHQQLCARQTDLMRTVRELSIPVVPLLPGVVLVPLVGVMTEERVSQMVEVILEGVARHRPHIVLLDITGLAGVDTHTMAQLLVTTRSIRIMGGQPILIGARPDISATLVKLGADVSRLTADSDLESSLARISTYLGRNGGG